MTIYITQGRYSQQAMKGLVAKPEDREAEVRKLIESSGGKLLSYYMTLGEYDFLLITENKYEEDALSPIAVAGVFGMNFDTPYAHTGEFGFWAVIICLSVIGIAFGFLSKWKKWI